MRSNIPVIFISILIFWLFLAPKSAIIPDSTMSGWISNIICIFLLCYVHQDLKYMFTGRYKTFNLLLLAYLAISVYSVYYNTDTISKYELSPLTIEMEDLPKGATSIKYILYNSIGLFASSLYIQRISNTKYIRTLLKTFFLLLLLVLIPTCVEVFTTPVEKNVTTEYSVGNKFSIGYYFLYLCTLYYFIHPYLNSQKHKYTLLFFIFLMIITSIISQCSTMIVGAFIFMFISLFISDTLRNRLASAKFIIISVLIFNIGFFFLATWILQFDFIQFIIKDLLNEDLTLTGRLQVFKDIQEAFTESPWIGLGYGNSIVVSLYYSDVYNSQNGLIELFIQIGVIGVATFLFLLYTAAKNFEKNDIPKYPFIAFMYAIIGISTVEIPFKLIFIFFLSFCFIQSKGYPKALLK